MTKEVRNVVHEGPIVAATLSDLPTRGQKSRDTTKRRERDLILLEAERVLSLVAQVIVNDLLPIPTYLILPTFFGSTSLPQTSNRWARSTIKLLFYTVHSL